MKDSRIKYDNKIWRVKEYTPFFFHAEIESEEMEESQTQESDSISNVIGLSILEKIEEANKDTLQYKLNEFNRAWKAFWKPVNDWLLKILNAL